MTFKYRDFELRLIIHAVLAEQGIDIEPEDIIKFSPFHLGVDDSEMSHTVLVKTKDRLFSLDWDLLFDKREEHEPIIRRAVEVAAKAAVKSVSKAIAK